MKPVGEPDAGIRTSGSMSGERNRGDALHQYPRLSSTLLKSMIGIALSVVQKGQRRYCGAYSKSSLEMRFGCNGPGTAETAFSRPKSLSPCFFSRWIQVNCCKGGVSDNVGGVKHSSSTLAPVLQRAHHFVSYLFC